MICSPAWLPGCWLLFGVGCFSGLETIGRFAGAFALDVGSLAWVDSPKLPCFLAGLVSLVPGAGPCWLTVGFDPEGASREPVPDPVVEPVVEAVADPVDDCELCLRGKAGRLFDAVLDTTNFFAAAVGFLSPLAGGTGLEARRVSTFFLFKPCALLPALDCEASPSESGTSANRAVGRGPVLEGPLGFFKIG